MLRASFLLLSLGAAAAAAAPACDGRSVKGAVRGTLRADDGPYLVTAPLLVEEGESLRIEPGTVLRFTAHTGLTVRGRLECYGEIVNTVRFTAAPPDTFAGAWDGITFDGEPASGEVRNSMVEYAVCGITVRAARDVALDNNILARNSHAGIVCREGACPRVSDNLVQFTGYGIIAAGYADPEITSNIVKETSEAGIYCIDRSSPALNHNVVTASKGPGVWCMAGSAPRIENNIIAGNGNGICCNGADPFIAGNSINRNRNNGILAHRSQPVITANNIFDNLRRNLAVVGRDSVSARENWWGEDAVSIAYTGRLEPSFMLDPAMFSGPVDASGFLMVPHEIGLEQPKAVVDVSLRNVSRAAQDTFCVGDRIRVELVGIDGSSTTRDHVGIVIQNPLSAERSSKLYLEETDMSSGVYRGTFTIGAEHLFQDSEGSSNLAVFSYINTTQKKQVKVLTTPPIIEQLAIDGNEHLQRVSPRRPLTLSWSYRVPDGKLQPQTGYQIQISDSAGFKNGAVIDSVNGTGPATGHFYKPLYLKEGKRYYVRVRARDVNSWSDWKTLAFRTNTPPAEPRPVFPLPDMELKSGLWPTMVAQTADDADGDRLAYVFEVYEDADMKKLFAAGDATTENRYQTWDLPRRLHENKTYYWRACAIDAVDSSAWSGLYRFSMDMEDEPIQPFDLAAPAADGAERVDDLAFSWTPATDPDPGAHGITYTLWISTQPDFSDKRVVSGLTETVFRPDFPLDYGTTYYWKVMASDGENAQWSNTESYPFQQFTTRHVQIAGN